MKQFFAKYIEDNIDFLKKYDKEILLKHKQDLLEKDKKGSDLDLYICATYLDMNCVILNEQFIVEKIFDDNKKNNINNDNTLFFITDDKGHMEPLINKGIIYRNKLLKSKAESLNKYLISINEKNKEIILENNQDKLDLNLTIPEINKIKLNLFQDNKADVKYKLTNRKVLYKSIREGKKLDRDAFIKYINSIKCNCSELFVYKDSKKNINDKYSDDEEINKIQISCAPNIVCYKCSIIIEDNGINYLIIKYFIDKNKFYKHVSARYKGDNKENIGFNMDSFNERFSLVADQISLNISYYLIDNDYIKNNKYIFDVFKEEIENKSINNKDGNSKKINEIINNKKNKIVEDDISVNFIEKICPNFNKELDEESKLDLIDAFNEEISNILLIIHFKTDTKLKDFDEKQISNKQKFKFLCCAECSFIDKYGNFGLNKYQI